MRRIRWAPAAANDLEQIRNYLREHHPSLAHATIQKLYNAGRSLKHFPNRGRIGQLADTRELVMSPLPYIIVYRVEPQMVHIFRVPHKTGLGAIKMLPGDVFKILGAPPLVRTSFLAGPRRCAYGRAPVNRA